MAIDDKPDEGYIMRFALERQAHFSGQRPVDDAAALTYLRKKSISALDFGDKNTDVLLRAGLAGLYIDLDINITSMEPGWHVNSVSQQKKDLTHTSDVLEPALAVAFKQSQVQPVWRRLGHDLPMFGRAASTLFAVPELWVETSFRKKVERYRELVEAEGEDAEQRQEIEALEDEIDAFKRDNFPIRWQWYDPRSVWPLFSDLYDLPEVVAISQMSAKEANVTYKLKDDEKLDDTRQQTVTVYRYANWEWALTAISEGSATPVEGQKARIVKDFHHKMGMNPFILMEYRLAPPNDLNIRWLNSMYHAQDLIDSLDQLLSDMKLVHFRYSFQKPFIQRDKSQPLGDVQLAGKKEKLEFDPSKDTVIPSGYELKPPAFPALNPESYRYLELVVGLIKEHSVAGPLRGQIKGDESGVLYNSAVQMAERQLDPLMQVKTEGCQKWAARFFKAVEFLTEPITDEDGKEIAKGDELTVVHQERGQITIGGKDVRGYYNLVQPRFRRGLPINENAQAKLAIDLIEGVGLSRRHVIEAVLNRENPQQLLDEAEDERQARALEQLKHEQILIRARVKMQKMPDAQMEQLRQRVRGLPLDQQIGLILAGAPGIEASQMARILGMQAGGDGAAPTGMPPPQGGPGGGGPVPGVMPAPATMGQAQEIGAGVNAQR